MKPVGKMLCLVLSAALISSCATPALWEATDPDQFIAVSQEDISESELQAAGLDWYRDDEKHLYYIEKDSLSKIQDYVFRIVATPVAFAVDAALVVGIILGVCYALAPGTPADDAFVQKYRRYLGTEKQYQKYLEDRELKEDMNRSRPLWQFPRE